TIIAVITKVVGCSLPARLAKMTVREAVAIGWGMTPRGEVGLVVAFAALSAGVVGNALFSMIVVVLILVTILPAALFRRALKAEPHSAIRKESTLEILRSVVEGHRANRVVVANLPVELRAVVSGALQGRSVQFLEDLPSTEVLPACAAAEVGVTWAEFAIAEDGAIVEVAHDDAARLAASLPIVHIVLLPAGRLVRDVGAAMAVVGGILRRSEEHTSELQS